MNSFVIPSFQRPTIFKEQTLAFLKKHNVDEKDIYLVLREDDPYLNDYLDRATDINVLITDVKGIGGTYQVVNPMFMSGCMHYTTDLRYMLGCLRFRFVRKELFLETNYAEDFENCIKHFIRDGAILKNNWVAPKTKNYQDGGCKSDGRQNDTEKSDKVFLSTKYPEYCKIFQRKSGIWDLRLKKYKQ